ncbi:hypothetical protein CONPUDRAFT_90562 [Coniophora puteana RWD-64-598 SS2]|uniref:DUF6532 domain-containing protein n=1 Tax=Coniophora puteana (strain RWD-64-598) TaxID=741705 RepID=A0A5M3MME5_CONPW|nr:uncharacterized protein CONPUDRAFT_90562 [Coniophora puteana RWD-64-598 SS2]EIW80283.1 hypothetical protein CONPUDRAFT_90562 [Coniophora puteana RWD-64-598 SS2]
MPSDTVLPRSGNKRPVRLSDKVKQNAAHAAEKDAQRRQQDIIRNQTRMVRDAKKAQKSGASTQASGTTKTKHAATRSVQSPARADDLFNATVVETLRSNAQERGYPLQLIPRATAVPPSTQAPRHRHGPSLRQSPSRRLTPDKVQQLIRERTNTPSSNEHFDQGDEDDNNVFTHAGAKRSARPSDDIELDDDDNFFTNKRLRHDLEVDDPTNDDDDLLMEYTSDGEINTTDDAGDISSSGDHTRRRPKARDFPSDVQQLIFAAIHVFYALMCNGHAFPTSFQEYSWSDKAWKKACDHYEHDIRLTAELRKLITDRTSHLRGELKTKARPLVASAFGFEDTVDEDAQAANRKLVEDLKKDSSFVYRVRGNTPEEHRGMFLAKIIQQLINDIFYKGKKATAVKWEEFFTTFPKPGFALVLSAIECAIDEWQSGSFHRVSFSEMDYRAVFETHLKNLDDFEGQGDNADQVLTKFMQRVHQIGSSHAGIATRSRAPQPINNPAVFATAKADMLLDLESN